VGQRADIVVLDPEHTNLSTMARKRWLDSWIFVPGRPAVDSVFAGVVSSHRPTWRYAGSQCANETASGLTH
jgi:cytosine/adenosine deaminase-related metal-dependent hydrolase